MRSGSYHSATERAEAVRLAVTVGPGETFDAIGRADSMTLDQLHRAGKLEQECSGCGTREAAGWYCTRCLRPVAQSQWRKTEITEPQRAARRASAERRSTRTKSASGRPWPAA